ncbi:MAG TPA: IPT/TIG domain-containing protein [Pyrinomonadaceae bacterium]|jgi:hypothetical protein|nr:IPT/TIG domain-containing protein [Pyrinomonadaceae bacterium]
MAVAAVKESTDQKKVIIAVALGVLAIVALWWTFFGFGSSPAKPQARPPGRPVATASPVPAGNNDPQPQPDSSADYVRVIGKNGMPPAVPEPRRNIFAFYVPPPSPTPKQVVVIPSPTPPPPLVLNAVSPANVYARTDDFKLEATGDKFTPAVHIVFDGRDLPTRFVSAQQIAATVPAAMITNPGQRSITVRSNDGLLYSVQLSLSVTAPPTPNYNYVGIIGKLRNIGDTAILQDKSSKEILSVQRGDVVGGRFRVSSISDREVVFVDTNLKIKHPLAMSSDGDRGSFPQGRPTPKVAAEDDEPQ